MIWYSTNSDLIYKKKSIVFNIHRNYLALDRIDRHLVWDNCAKTNLAKLTTKKIYICGSLLFYPRVKPNRMQDDKSFRVLLFDVTPQEDTSNDDFPNPNQAMNTIREIVKVIEDLKLESNKVMKLFIKPKRTYQKYHSSEYVQYIRVLHKQRKLKLLNHTENLYKVINSADLVICFPWTSPAVIARELGVESVYYVSDSNKEWKLEHTRNIKLIRNEIALKRFVRKCLSAELK
jgi:polysaccharide biosynthesis PFTS motif protein